MLRIVHTNDKAKSYLVNSNEILLKSEPQIGKLTENVKLQSSNGAQAAEILSTFSESLNE
jgi:hypothetical protein